MGRAAPDRFMSGVPFEYGWAILAAGALGAFMTTPGQTVGVSALFGLFWGHDTYPLRAGGPAGKAVYRGDMLTRGAGAGILEGDFIAQAFAAPSERRVHLEGAPQTRKLDVRLCT